MTHNQAQEYVKKKVKKELLAHLGFAAFFGGETPKYERYPFSTCKEFPLDAHQNYFRANPDKPLNKTGFLLVANELHAQNIEKSLHNLETIFRFGESSVKWFSKEGVVSVIGSKLWHTTPAMLSLYMAVARLTVVINKPIDFKKIKTMVSAHRDANIFRHSKWEDFVKLVKSRKIKHCPKYFLGRQIHMNGINSFLGLMRKTPEGEKLDVKGFFDRKNWDFE